MDIVRSSKQDIGSKMVSPDFVVKLKLKEKGTCHTRRVKLSRVAEGRHKQPSYEQLLNRIDGFFSRRIGNGCVLQLKYKDKDGDDVVVTTSEELCDAVQQFRNQGVLTLEGCLSPNRLIPAGLLARSEGEIKFPAVRFNRARTSSGIALQKGNQRLVQTASKGHRKWAYGTAGFETGCHYWTIRLLSRGAHNICIGVSDGTTQLDSYWCDCHGRAPGATSLSVSTHGASFIRSELQSRSFEPIGRSVIWKNVTDVGVLLDMDLRMLTFFADGKKTGICAGADALTAPVYYPIVSLDDLGQSLKVVDLVSS